MAVVYFISYSVVDYKLSSAPPHLPYHTESTVPPLYQAYSRHRDFALPIHSAWIVFCRNSHGSLSCHHHVQISSSLLAFPNNHP